MACISGVHHSIRPFFVCWKPFNKIEGTGPQIVPQMQDRAIIDHLLLYNMIIWSTSIIRTFLISIVFPLKKYIFLLLHSNFVFLLSK